MQGINYLLREPSSLFSKKNSSRDVNIIVRACEKGRERMHGSVRERLISNWTNPAFQEFVERLRSLVDEIGSNHQEGSDEWKECKVIVGKILYAECEAWPPIQS